MSMQGPHVNKILMPSKNQEFQICNNTEVLTGANITVFFELRIEL